MLLACSSRVRPSLNRTIQTTLYGLAGPSIIGISSIWALMFQSQSMSNTLGPSSTTRCHAGVVIACWKSARSFHHAHE